MCAWAFVCRGDWYFDRLQETRQRERFYVLSDDITHLRALKHTLPAHDPQETHLVKFQMMSEQIKWQHASLGVPYFRLCMTKREGKEREKEVEKEAKREKERERESCFLSMILSSWCSFLSVSSHSATSLNLLLYFCQSFWQILRLSFLDVLMRIAYQ